MHTSFDIINVFDIHYLGIQFVNTFLLACICKTVNSTIILQTFCRAFYPLVIYHRLPGRACHVNGVSPWGAETEYFNRLISHIHENSKIARVDHVTRFTNPAQFPEDRVSGGVPHRDEINGSRAFYFYVFIDIP
jgi:hypothetical protein